MRDDRSAAVRPQQAFTAPTGPRLPAGRATPRPPVTPSLYLYLDHDRPRSVGRVKGFYGNIGVLLHAYAYILSMGADRLRQASGDAVLNANYLRVRLRDRYHVPYGGVCVHEFVASASRAAQAGRLARHREAHPRLRHPLADHLLPLDRPEAAHDRNSETKDLETLRPFREPDERHRRRDRSDPEAVRSATRCTRSRRRTRPRRRGILPPLARGPSFSCTMAAPTRAATVAALPKVIDWLLQNGIS